MSRRSKTSCQSVGPPREFPSEPTDNNGRARFPSTFTYHSDIKLEPPYSWMSIWATRSANSPYSPSYGTSRQRSNLFGITLLTRPTAFHGCGHHAFFLPRGGSVLCCRTDTNLLMAIIICTRTFFCRFPTYPHLSPDAGNNNTKVSHRGIAQQYARSRHGD